MAAMRPAGNAPVNVYYAPKQANEYSRLRKKQSWLGLISGIRPFPLEALEKCGQSEGSRQTESLSGRMAIGITPSIPSKSFQEKL